MNQPSRFSHVRSWASDIESLLADGISGLAPWLTPIPSAALVAQATITHLKWIPALGWISALVIESMGIATVSTALTLWSYNISRRKTDAPAPLSLAASLVGIYLLTTIGLTVLLDIFPDLARFAPALFPVQALLGAVNLALRGQHTLRVQAILAEKAERKAERSAGRSGWDGYEWSGLRSENRIVSDQRADTFPALPGEQTTTQTVTMPTLTDANQVRKVSKEQAMANLLAYFGQNPTASYSQAAKAVGRSKPWVTGTVAELEKAGKLKRSEQGIKVLSGWA